MKTQLTCIWGCPVRISACTPTILDDNFRGFSSPFKFITTTLTCSRNYLRKLIQSGYKKKKSQDPTSPDAPPRKKNKIGEERGILIFGALFKKKNTILGMKVNIYLGPKGRAIGGP
jgi:hypothetical protein